MFGVFGADPCSTQVQLRDRLCDQALDGVPKHRERRESFIPDGARATNEIVRGWSELDGPDRRQRHAILTHEMEANHAMTQVCFHGAPIILALPRVITGVPERATAVERLKL